LHGGEELDLAARLDAAGWRLVRLPGIAADHYGHSGNAFSLLLRRIVTRNACAPGEIVRAAVGRPHFWYVVRQDRNFLLCCLVAAWWASIAAGALLADGLIGWLAVVGAIAVPFAGMSLRWRSLHSGLYSVAVWNAFALCFFPGFLGPRTAPARWMASTVIADSLTTTDAAPVVPG
jgi:hypothetical protein